MKIQKMLLLLSLTLSVSTLSPRAFAEGKPSQNPDALAIDQACVADAQTAGCGSEQVGTGLLKCIHAYKRGHRKEFKVSDGCKAAMEKARADRKAKKGAGK